MVQITVLYPFTEGADFNFDHYVSVHVEMVKKFFGDDAWDISVEKGVEGGKPGAKPAFIAVFRMRTHSIETWHKHIGDNFDEFVGDIPNFTSIQPKVLFADVLVG